MGVRGASVELLCILLPRWNEKRARMHAIVLMDIFLAYLLEVIKKSQGKHLETARTVLIINAWSPFLMSNQHAEASEAERRDEK